MRSRPRKEWTSSRTWLSITTHSASKYHLNPPEPECAKLPLLCASHPLKNVFQNQPKKKIVSLALFAALNVNFLSPVWFTDLEGAQSCIYSSHKYAQVIIQICSDSYGVWWVNKWALSVPEPQLTTACDRMTNFLSVLLGPVLTLGQNNILPPLICSTWALMDREAAVVMD